MPVVRFAGYWGLVSFGYAVLEVESALAYWLTAWVSYVCMQMCRLLTALGTPRGWRGIAEHGRRIGSTVCVLLLVGMVINGVGGSSTSSPRVKDMTVRVHEWARSSVDSVGGPMGDRMRFLINESAAVTTQCTPISVMNNADLKALNDFAGLASKSHSKVGDSGAAVHVVTSKARAIPGTVRVNTMQVSTANGCVAPPYAAIQPRWAVSR